MKCPECRDLLQQEADGAEPRPSGCGRSTLEQHLRACPACRTFQTGLRRLAEVLRQVSCPPPPADFAARLTAAVLADRTRPPVAPAQRQWVRPLLALAASLLVALSLFAWHWLTPEHPVAQPDPEVVKIPPTPVAPGNLRESMREAGSALTALTTQTADEVVEATRKMLPTVPTPNFPSLDPMGLIGATPSLPPSQGNGVGLAQAGQAVADGLEPVTTSARRAYDLFLRDVPLGTEGQPGL